MGIALERGERGGDDGGGGVVSLLLKVVGVVGVDVVDASGCGWLCDLRTS